MIDGAVRLRVLVVEDEPLIGMDIEDAVEELGHEVVGPIAELHEALDLATTTTLNCAILDVNIVGGHSYPIADKLLLRGLPILLLSGNRPETLPTRLHRVPFLSKPFTSAQLAEKMLDLCAKAAGADQ